MDNEEFAEVKLGRFRFQMPLSASQHEITGGTQSTILRVFPWPLLPSGDDQKVRDARFSKNARNVALPPDGPGRIERATCREGISAIIYKDTSYKDESYMAWALMRLDDWGIEIQAEQLATADLALEKANHMLNKATSASSAALTSQTYFLNKAAITLPANELFKTGMTVTSHPLFSYLNMNSTYSPNPSDAEQEKIVSATASVVAQYNSMFSQGSARSVRSVYRSAGGVSGEEVVIEELKSSQAPSYFFKWVGSTETTNGVFVRVKADMRVQGRHLDRYLAFWDRLLNSLEPIGD